MSTENETHAFAAVLLLITLAVIGAMWTWDGNAQNDCVSRGGHVAHIHGGRGGWVCIPPVCSSEGVCVSPR